LNLMDHGDVDQWINISKRNRLFLEIRWIMIRYLLMSQMLSSDLFLE
jgi:hypothetical protein